MKIRNEIETAVRDEVERQKECLPGAEDFCWCALCEADVIALAMTSLPPRYTTVHSLAVERRRDLSLGVKSTVFSAMKRVARRVKHLPRAPEMHSARVRLVNFGFNEGISKVAILLGQSQTFCSCPQCQADTLAYALNRYPPKYGVRHHGQTKLPDFQIEYMRHELDIIITHAAGVVASNPRHSPPPVH